MKGVAAKLTVRDLCFIGIFTAIIILLSMVTIPMPMGVPFTMQTFALFLAGLLLGSKKAFFSATTYLLLGMMGLPIFSGFKGGLAVLVGPTCGFLLSFPIMAAIAGIAHGKNKLLPVAFWLTSAALINFACGLFGFMLVTGNQFYPSLLAVVVPFLPTTIIKILLAGTTSLAITKRTNIFKFKQI